MKSDAKGKFRSGNALETTIRLSRSSDTLAITPGLARVALGRCQDRNRICHLTSKLTLTG
jgi:hypothetical protein